MKKAPQTLFGMQSKSNKEAHKLMIALNMVGINANIPACRLILKAQEAVNKMGGKFDLETACKIQVENDEYFATMEEVFNDKQKTVLK
jgi:hypothetical protein